jgi:hypothetical protein
MTVTAAGTTTPVLASVVCPTGNAAVAEVPGVSGALAATAGCRISGSVLTGIFFGAGVKTGLPTTPALVWLFDKQP